ncbi:MAG TPA: iron-sulfur cluster assembly scaffold protein [Syntrophobacter fumaroxidans]|nr:iron-sulfur cluster assembly scaffold protein [Syntrophobacter fumaroxidans]
MTRMDDKTLDFWRNHSVRFLEMALTDHYREVPANPDGYARVVRECGDTVEMFLMVRDGKIRTASFETNGCIYSVACANTAVHLASGLTPEEARRITPDQIVEFLETLPPEEEHCAEQAVKALRLALADARDGERQPWKKYYQRR